jgi:hypothetical protein
VKLAGHESNASRTAQEGDGQELPESALLVKELSGLADAASQVFTFPASAQERPPWTVNPPVAPMPSTPFRKLTPVPEELVA